MAVPLEIILGLAFAIYLNRRVKFESVYETLYFLPYIVPMVPSAIIWKWVYAPEPTVSPIMFWTSWVSPASAG